MKKKDLDENVIEDIDEDIFSDKNAQKNKSKTKLVLLSIIIAVIIIIILIIAAWILTRDNNIQIPVEEASTSKMIEKSQNTQNTLDSNPMEKENNLDLHSKLNNDLQGLGEYDKLPDTIPSLQNEKTKDVFDFSNDPKFQAILSQQKGLNSNLNEDKPLVLANTAADNKPKKEKIDNKSLENNKAVETTKNNQKEIAKNTTKLEDKKPSQDSKTQDPKVIKTDKVVEAAKNTNPKNQDEVKKPANITKSNSTKPNVDSIKEVTKGHYLQVGAFTSEANKIFLDKISKYKYRIERSEADNKKVTKYLIGPYPSKTDAMKEIQQVNTEIGRAFYRYIN